MKQILQNLGSGELSLAEVPCPSPAPGFVLVRSEASLISMGTERMLIDFGRAGWIEKARQQPDKVKAVLEKVRSDGLLPTLEAVRSKLDTPIGLGYSNAGTIVELGAGTAGFEIGDRVVTSGPHAEMVCVPKNLCAKIPAAVPSEEACFTVVAAIGLQGIRLLEPTLGEAVVVTGLGLVGLLCVQLLRANGCRVLGIDVDSNRCALAREFGAETVDLSKGQDPMAASEAFSLGRGVDAVLISASTQSDEPIHQAARMCRKRGRIVLIGVVGLKLSRADFYEKELSFQVSCSYGPGRYDPDYELKGRDYPFGFVRWTEQRNFEAVLQLMAESRLAIRSLISHRFPFSEALKAYDLVEKGAAIGMVLTHDKAQTSSPGAGIQVSERETAAPNTGHAPQPLLAKAVQLRSKAPPKLSAGAPSPVIGFIGAGNFAGQVLLPALGKTGVRLKTIVSSAGVTGTHLGKKFGFEVSSTDPQSVFSDGEITAVIIATRHSSHARYALLGLESGKQVYVEKPLCLRRDELNEIVAAYERAGGQPNTEALPAGHRFEVQGATGTRSAGENAPFLMVGFNRRFAPQVQEIVRLLQTVRGPKNLTMTVNAGMVPSTHWVHDRSEGGGRIIGEACHFIDLLRFLVGDRIVEIQTCQGGDAADASDDQVTFTLLFADGSMGTVHYFANGHKSFPKERLEIFCAGRVLSLDNFRKLIGYGWPQFRRKNLWRQDKGHAAEMQAFVDAISKRSASPIPFHEIVEVTKTSFDVADQVRGAPGSRASAAATS